MLKQINLNTIQLPSDFVIYEGDKYLICGSNMIILINENEQVSLRIHTNIRTPLGICISSDNNDIFVNEANLRGVKLKISVFGLAGGVLRK